MRHKPTHQSWMSMHARVKYPNRHNHYAYKALGVTICDRWKSYEAFLEDMGERPAGHTLDRKDPLGGYSPTNCRWATSRDQSRNRVRMKLDFDKAVALVIERLGGATQRVLATKYGCSKSLVKEIMHGRCWPDALIEAMKRMESRA